MDSGSVATTSGVGQTTSDFTSSSAGLAAGGPSLSQQSGGPPETMVLDGYTLPSSLVRSILEAANQLDGKFSLARVLG